MAQQIEITGEIHVDLDDYASELREKEPSEPRLLSLRQALEAPEPLSRQQRRALAEGVLCDLLSSYEVSIASEIQYSLGRDYTNIEHLPSKQSPFEVSIRFSRGSLLYTVTITIFDIAGPALAKTGFGSLMVAAVEPVALKRVQKVCEATKSITSHVRRVVDRSIPETGIASAAIWTDDKIRDLTDRITQLSARLDATRHYRQIRGLMLLLLGLFMANFAALIAIAHKIGLF